MGFLQFCSLDCLFNAIIELHAMDEKHSMTFSLESESGFYVRKAYGIHDV